MLLWLLKSSEFWYDVEVRADTSLSILLIAEFVLCSGQGNESVTRIFVPEVLPTGVQDGFRTGMTDYNCLVQVMTAVGEAGVCGKCVHRESI